MVRISGTNDVFRGLCGVLGQIQDTTLGIAATQYWHDGFTEGVSRFDALTIYNDRDMPNVTIIDQFRAIPKVKKSELIKFDPETGQAAMNNTPATRSRFLITVDGKNYIAFPNYRRVGFGHWSSRRPAKGEISTRFDYGPERETKAQVPSQGFFLGANLAFARTANGIYWLNPDATTDEAKLFLSFGIMNGVPIARLQFGNDIRMARDIVMATQFPTFEGKVDFPHEIPQDTVIGAGQLIPAEMFHTLFNGAKFYLSTPRVAARVAGPKELDGILKELNVLVGMKDIKAQMAEFAATMRFRELRKSAGLKDEEPLPLHTVFQGPPGTGKTTVANMLGRIYKSLGLLSKGHVVKVSRADLVAEYVGQTAPQTRAAIERARGGVLFIDEAYSLVPEGSSKNDFGPEALAEILQEMSDGEGDIAIVMAGYPSPMQALIASNEGLKSRIGRTFDFPNYTPEELVAIASVVSKRSDVTLDDAALSLLSKHLMESFRGRDDSFGNARMVAGLIRDAKAKLAVRLSLSGRQKFADGELATITATDMLSVIAKKTGKTSLDIPINEEALAQSLTELDALVGLDEIKQDVRNMVALVRYYREEGIDPKQEFQLNLVFSGNPGTGKTTVARLIARIYKALGLLERGHLVEGDRSSLVAEYIGQTAPKTNAVVDKAIGGVLFVDEAYMLAGGGERDFGPEAIATILKRMEDQRGQFATIMAGYPEPMRRLLESNEGLQSRFDSTLTFKDYTPAQLTSYVLTELSQKGLTPDDAAKAAIEKYFEQRVQSKDTRTFGNVREARNAVEAMKKKHNLRLAKMPKEARTPELKSVITVEDVAGLGSGRPQARAPMGFGSSSASNDNAGRPKEKIV